MRILAALSLASALFLAGCGGTPTAQQRAAANSDLNPSGRPYVGPTVLSSTPPADTNIDRLYCHPEGIGASCDRQP